MLFRSGQNPNGTDTIGLNVFDKGKYDIRHAAGEFTVDTQSDEQMRALWYRFQQPPAATLGKVR